MKLSLYNTSLTIDDRHTVIYNAMSDNCIFLKNRILDLSNLPLDILKDNYPKLYSQLIEGGFLIGKNVDEVDKLKERILAAENNVDEYILNINPTLDCNLKCWYCYENHIKGSRISQRVKASILNFLDSIIKEKSTIKRFYLGFFGGEPLMHFFSTTSEIIKYAEKLCNEKDIQLKLNFTSNATLLNDKIIAFLSSYNSSFQITLDGSETEHNKTRFYSNGNGSYKTIINNIHKLVINGVSVIVRINYTHANVHSTNGILKDFSNLEDKFKRNLCFDFQCVWQERRLGEDLIAETIENVRNHFQEAGFHILRNDLPKNVLEPCYGDKVNHTLINYNGEVFGCTARDFTTKNRLGVLNEEGKVIYDDGKYEKWSTARFKKVICHTCRIAPLCGGGCRQNAYDSFNSPSCTRGYSEKDKDAQVLNLIDAVILQRGKE